jgi:hypothetical protein
MAAYDLLKDIVRNGSDLTLYSGISYDVIRELAVLAQRSGARLTITTSMSYELIRELSAQCGRSISFVDGMDAFRKE